MFECIEKHPIRYLMLFAVTLLIIVPVIIAWLIDNIPFNLTSYTDNSDWLAFWATFGGNVIGLLGLALVTVYQDKKQQKYIEQQDENQKEYISNQKVIDDNRLRIQLIRESVYSNIENILFLKKSVISIIESIYNDLNNASEIGIGFDIKEYNDEIFDMLTKISEINILLKTNDKYLSIETDEKFKIIIDKIRSIVLNLNKFEAIHPYDEIFDSGSYLAMFEQIKDIESSKYDIHDCIMEKLNSYHIELSKEIMNLEFK